MENENEAVTVTLEEAGAMYAAAEVSRAAREREESAAFMAYQRAKERSEEAVRVKEAATSVLHRAAAGRPVPAHRLADVRERLAAGALPVRGVWVERHPDERVIPADVAAKIREG